jgi:hypothetical protein
MKGYLFIEFVLLHNLLKQKLLYYFLFYILMKYAVFQNRVKLQNEIVFLGSKTNGKYTLIFS